MSVPGTEEPRTRVEVGRAYQSRFRVRSVHHVVVPVKNSEPTMWQMACSGGRALREYTGWLETAITCPRCIRQAGQ